MQNYREAQPYLQQLIDQCIVRANEAIREMNDDLSDANRDELTVKQVKIMITDAAIDNMAMTLDPENAKPISDFLVNAITERVNDSVSVKIGVL